MIILKNERDVEAMRQAGSVAGAVLEEVSSWIKPGLTTREIDQYAAGRIKFYGARSAFLGYRKYPCHVCISVNEQVVHGLAGDQQVQFGDIVSLDVGVVYHGYIGDTARTVAVGGCDLLSQKLMDVTEKRYMRGSLRLFPAIAWSIFHAPSKTASSRRALVWSANLSDMASAGACMKSRRCRILWTANRPRNCGPG
jgi:methionine aminopeptidase